MLKQSSSGRAISPLAATAVAVMALAAIAAGSLWAHYGTAVFLETIRAGLAACF